MFCRNFIAIPLGPDAIYIVDFAYLQISVTATMCLIFVPKVLYDILTIEMKAGCSANSFIIEAGESEDRDGGWRRVVRWNSDWQEENQEHQTHHYSGSAQHRERCSPDWGIHEI